MNTNYRHLAAAVLLAGIGLTAAAQAPQPATVAPGGPPPHMRDGGPRGPMAHPGGDMRERMGRHMADRMAGRMAQLKQQLAITPQQEGAWNNWLNAVRPQQRNRMERPNMVQFARMTTPERIDRIKQLRAQRAQQMDQRLDATRGFYSTLNAQQQRVFDEQSMALLKGGRGMRGGRHGGGQHGPYAR
ncbi:MAG: Spy/CpxP family protein refolding chaperone [Burkholderiales bacterium]|nr:Spy/CpxP family protein refolding chaperone [Burkholderiales bacterium]